MQRRNTGGRFYAPLASALLAPSVGGRGMSSGNAIGGPSDLKGATMTEMFANRLKLIREQSFAMVRPEDYIQPLAGHRTDRK